MKQNRKPEYMERKYYDGRVLRIPVETGSMKATDKEVMALAPKDAAVGVRYADEAMWEAWLAAPGAQTFDEWAPTVYKPATCWDCKTEYYIPLTANFLLCEHCRAGTPVAKVEEKRTAHKPEVFLSSKSTAMTTAHRTPWHTTVFKYLAIGMLGVGVSILVNLLIHLLALALP